MNGPVLNCTFIFSRIEPWEFVHLTQLIFGKKALSLKHFDESVHYCAVTATRNFHILHQKMIEFSTWNCLTVSSTLHCRNFQDISSMPGEENLGGQLHSQMPNRRSKVEFEDNYANLYTLYKHITSSRSKSCKIQLFASKFSWGSGLRTWRTSWWRFAVSQFSRKTTGNRWSLRNCAAKCILKSTHEYCCCCCCCHYILFAPAFVCWDFVIYLDDITCAAVFLFSQAMVLVIDELKPLKCYH